MPETYAFAWFRNIWNDSLKKKTEQRQVFKRWKNSKWPGNSKKAGKIRTNTFFTKNMVEYGHVDVWCYKNIKKIYTHFSKIF